MDTPSYPNKLLKQFIIENKNSEGNFWDDSGFASIAEILENHFKSKDWDELSIAVKNWPGEFLYFLINGVFLVQEYTYYDSNTDLNNLANNRLKKHYESIIPRLVTAITLLQIGINHNDKAEFSDDVAFGSDFFIYHFDFIVKNDVNGLERIQHFVDSCRHLEYIQIFYEAHKAKFILLQDLIDKVK